MSHEKQVYHMLLVSISPFCVYFLKLISVMFVVLITVSLHARRTSSTWWMSGFVLVVLLAHLLLVVAVACCRSLWNVLLKQLRLS